MICLLCRAAADARAPRDQHCNTVPGPGAACDCQHRTDRYQPKPDDGLTAFEALWEQHLGRVYRVMVDATCLPPAACRCGGQRFAGQIVHNTGCLWKNDPEPLRRVAAEALGETEPGSVRRDPRADDPDYDPITGYRTWDELEADPPQFTGLLAILHNNPSEK